jgi:hypothetical protein
MQTVLYTGYDRAAYDVQIDHRADAVPPLTVEQSAWAFRVLQAKGLR